ncbi:hypothetical protein EZV73_12445 [Acidaminobacter sp. JC074]|uniref:hypothetical protein n=1 Tax=Acidaminobacter sp. JC074 TaxID=2530199 RepID=UPI001F0F2DBC|nr:hypothetical protein [Acidaminobacter sp. JC074]MCH4888392.1 hypothetical protein [Acidaminobacter sp. JC074]
MSNEKGVKEKATFDEKSSKVYNEDNEVIATFNMDTKEVTSKSGGTTYSENPIYGSSGDYNQLISIVDGDVRFTEKVLNAVESGTVGYATGLILKVLLTNPYTGIVVGGVVGLMYAFLRYNPQPYAYFSRWKYENDDIPRYYKYVQIWYWNPSHDSYAATNVYYTSEW